MAMACFRFFTGPALPPGPLLSSPCAYSCMTRPTVLRWLGAGLEEDVDVDGVIGMGVSSDAPLSPDLPNASSAPKFPNRTREVTRLMAQARSVRLARHKDG